jgi:signal peptidase I
VVVPEGYVYVLGDHRSNSSDSRVFGAVPVENIVGKAWLSYWPADDVGFVPHESYTDEEQSAALLPSP